MSRVSDPESPAPIIDSVSHQAVELAELGSKIPVQTRVGRELLGHLLYRGLPDQAAVERQQGAVQELLDDNYSDLRGSLRTAIGKFGASAGDLLAFSRGAESWDRTYTAYSKASVGAHTLEKLVEATAFDRGFPLRTTPTCEAINTISEFNESRGAALLRGPPLLHAPRSTRERGA